MGDKLSAMMIFSVVFLGIFAFLGAIMPIQLVESFEMRNQTTPEGDYWEASQLQYFAETMTINFSETGKKSEKGDYLIKDIDIGGHDFDAYFSKANLTHHRVALRHFWCEWIILLFHYDMKWYNKRGEQRDQTTGSGVLDRYITGEKIQQDWELEDAEYNVLQPESFQVTVYLGYNTTKYENVTDAWDHYDLHMLVGIGFDDVNTTINAWHLISMILFFQTPQIHPVFNFVISLPLWVSMAFLVTKVVLWFIPFVSGGA